MNRGLNLNFGWFFSVDAEWYLFGKNVAEIIASRYCVLSKAIEMALRPTFKVDSSIPKQIRNPDG